MWQPRDLGGFYVDLLQDRLGLPAELDEENDIVFNYAGTRLFIVNTAPEDPGYLRVVLGVRFSEATADDLHAACHRANARWKGVKAITWGDVLELAYEAFVAPDGCRPEVQQVVAALPRVIDVLMEAMVAAIGEIDPATGQLRGA